MEAEIITEYFFNGFQYNMILRLLSIYHGIHISRRTLLRRLRDLNLRRHSQSSPMLDIWNAVQLELRGPGRVGGYRSMWHTLRTKYHLRTTRENVRLILQQTDPVGVMNRRCHRLRRRTYVSRGPNDTWHVDGYDKLSPYGILISGCIDGYSRRIMWLTASYTNHKPQLIASYYLTTVDQVGGYPAHVRTDCGTENGIIAAIQSLVTGHDSAHTYGTSPGNQRIEAWWSFFRRNHSQYYIDLFEELHASGAFHPGNVQQVDCLRYAFMSVIQGHLDEVKRHWNTHRIRSSVGSRCPAGIPDILYHLPNAPAVNCLIQNNAQLPNEIHQQLEEPRTCQDTDFAMYLDYLRNFFNLPVPHDTDSALKLYFELVRNV